MLIFFFNSGEKKTATKISPAANKGPHSKSCVALRATSLAAAVAQNGYFDQNVAPTQQRNI